MIKHAILFVRRHMAICMIAVALLSVAVSLVRTGGRFANPFAMTPLTAVGMQVRRAVNRRNRRGGDPSNQPSGTDAVATGSIVANKWRLSFNIPVAPQAIPTDFKVNGASAISITQISPTVFDLGYTVNVAAAQTWVIPNKSPNFRTRNGGFVAAATGTF